MAARLGSTRRLSEECRLTPRSDAILLPSTTQASRSNWSTGLGDDDRHFFVGRRVMGLLVIVSIDHPFTGPVHVGSEPFQAVVEDFGHG